MIPARRMVMVWVVGTLVIAAVVSFLIAYVAADAALEPDPPRDTPYLDQFPFPVEDVAFAARDATPLSGWFLTAAPPRGEQPTTQPQPTVVLLHGYGGTRDVMLPYASFLSDAGFHVFFFDARGVGTSVSSERPTGAQVTFGETEAADVIGALDYLGGRPEVDQSRIAVMGVELGASVAIMAAAQDRRVAAVVAEAPYASLSRALRDALDRRVAVPRVLRPLATYLVMRRITPTLDDDAPLAAAAQLDGRPLLVIEDSRDLTDQSQAIFTAAGQPKTLWIAHGASLGQGLREFPIEYVAQTVGFLRSTIGAPAASAR